MKKSTSELSNKYFIISIIFVVALVLYQHKDAMYGQLDRWRLMPRGEHFTELYFDNHTALPKKVASGEAVSFSFIVHNLEGESMVYPYNIYFKDQNGRVVDMEEKSVTLADGESRTIKESYSPAVTEDKGGIFVELPQKKQEIHFLILIS